MPTFCEIKQMFPYEDANSRKFANLIIFEAYKKAQTWNRIDSYKGKSERLNKLKNIVTKEVKQKMSTFAR